MKVLMLRYWSGRAHDLGRMSLGRLTRTFFSYPAIATYMAIAAGCLGYVAWRPGSVWALAAAAIAASLVYPLAWYLLHRFVLHGRWLYKIPQMAALWKRIHFDHHQDPLDLRVLFGGLHTTLPTIVLITAPIGWAIGGPSGAAMATAVALLTTCFYEFVHCVQHLNHLRDWAWLREMKRLHQAHHYHSEQGNFGITDFFWDRVFGTYYNSAKDEPRSPTVFNLGYTAEEAKRYPWVLELSGGERRDDGPRAASRQGVNARTPADTGAGPSADVEKSAA
ncbi:MAG: sterol desaturase family protein [Maricaulaceae bacterium]